MSRINADVIDVLENKQTRVEILTIDGEDAGELLEDLKNPLQFERIGSPTRPAIINNVLQIGWNLSQANYQKLIHSSLVIFTMNNTFVMSPLSTTGEARCVGSFIYNDSGNSMVVRLKFVARPNSLVISFDSNFKDALDFSSLLPEGALYIL